MRKLTALATSLLALAAAPAFAGGYVAPVVDVEPVVVTPAPIVGTWTGGYVGANLNYGKAKFSGSEDVFDDDVLDGTLTYSTKPDGGNAALRAGYDWQRGNGVFGLGAEYNFAKYKGDYTETFTPVDETAMSLTGEARLKDVGTVFLRAGYAFNDQLMAYGLLGYSWGKVEASAVVDGPDPEVFAFSESVDGPTVGLGAEYRFNPNWSGYAEYAYTDFGKIGDTNDKLKLDQVKLGVNFRF